MAARARDRATDARGCAARECENATFFRFTLARPATAAGDAERAWSRSSRRTKRRERDYDEKIDEETLR